MVLLTRKEISNLKRRRRTVRKKVSKMRSELVDENDEILGMYTTLKDMYSAALAMKDSLEDTRFNRCMLLTKLALIRKHENVIIRESAPRPPPVPTTPPSLCSRVITRIVSIFGRRN